MTKKEHPQDKFVVELPSPRVRPSKGYLLDHPSPRIEPKSAFLKKLERQQREARVNVIPLGLPNRSRSR